MSYYMPTTEDFREDWSRTRGSAVDPAAAEFYAHKQAVFDRWLAEVKSIAWDVGYSRGVRDAESDLDPADNPYRDKPRGLSDREREAVAKWHGKQRESVGPENG